MEISRTESSWFIDSSQLVRARDSSFSQSFRADDLWYTAIVGYMGWVRAFVVTRASTLSAAAMMMALPLSASAALGGDVSSVQSDRVKMSGALLRITATGSSTVHEIQASSGTVVREFISPAGKVFGVAWEGPWIPDLREMLGMYFEQYTTLAQAASIPGVSPNDLQNLVLEIEKRRRVAR